MVLTNIEDFVIPTLQVLSSLGGEARVHDVEESFWKRYQDKLDPIKDWTKVTPNHNKEMWRDYCGTRVAHYFLFPEGYIEIERHGSKGSKYRLTPKGKLKLSQ